MLSQSTAAMFLVLVLTSAFASKFAVPPEFKEQLNWKQQRENFDWLENLSNPFTKNQAPIVRDFSFPEKFEKLSLGKTLELTPKKSLEVEKIEFPVKCRNPAPFLIPEKMKIILKQSQQKKQVSFAHANVRGWEKTKDVILNYATENDVKIFSISEHHIARKAHVGKLQKYNWEGSYRESSWGGSALLIHKSIRYKQISDQFDFQMEKTAIEFTFENESYCVFSIYLPQRSDAEIDQMEKLLFHLHETRDRWQNIILLGDFNAWNLAWGNRNNRRGVRLLDAIIKSEFTVEKLPKATRIGNKNQKNTFVDLVITNRNDGVMDLTVGQKVSDHRLLSFVFTREPRNCVIKAEASAPQFSIKIAQMLLKHARFTVADRSKQTMAAGSQTLRTADISAAQNVLLWNAILIFSQIFLFFQMFSSSFQIL